MVRGAQLARDRRRYRVLAQRRRPRSAVGFSGLASPVRSFQESSVQNQFVSFDAKSALLMKTLGREASL